MNMSDVKEITIPAYRELEYIHFNGAEYIHDTYNPYPGMKLTLTFKADEASEMYSGTNATSSGTGAASTNNTLGSNASGQLAGWLLGSYRSYANYSALDKHAFTVDRYNGKVYIDGTEVTSGTSYYGGTNINGLYWGCRAASDNTLGFYMKANIYRITITNQGEAAFVRDMRPVQRKSDGLCGLFDLINKKFWPMQGTIITDGAAGPVINENFQIDVKKIEDSNGNIIWGSQSAFPYRRLEYIHFSGAEGIDLEFKPASTGNTGALQLKAKITGPTASGTYGIIMGCSGSYNSSTGYMRIFCQSSAENVGQRVGRNSSSFGYSTAMTNDIRWFRLRTPSASSTYIDILDDTGTLISGTSHTTSASYTSSSMPNINLMRHVQANSIIAAGYSQGDIYQYIQYQTTLTEGIIVKNMFPCQRKSDNVCGLYDIVNQLFYPMQGTNITTAAAGTVADEYWDLQSY